MRCQLFLILLLGGVSISCERKPIAATSEPTYSAPEVTDSKEKVLIVGVHPLYKPERMNESFGPIMNVLDKAIPGYRFVLESSTDYPSYEKKIKDKKFELLLPNPYQTLLAQETGYKIFGKMGDDHNFRGTFLVRKDSAIKSISDLKGKAVSFPAQTALAAAMLPQYYLYKNGVHPNKDLYVSYVGSQESSMYAVLHKKVEVGVTWPMAWNALKSADKEIAEKLVVLFESDTLPNNSLMARSDLAPELVSKIEAVFLNLHNTDVGQQILSKIKLSKFETASEKTYLPVKNFMTKFKKELGTVVAR